MTGPSATKTFFIQPLNIAAMNFVLGKGKRAEKIF